MGTRAQVCVALLLTSFVASGCIFGKGAKKRAREAARLRAAAEREALSGDSPALVAELKQRSAKQKALEDALAPQQSAVQWPDAAGFSLGGDQPRRAQTGTAAVQDELESEVTEPRVDRSIESDRVAQPGRKTDSSPAAAVANAHIEIADVVAPALAPRDATDAPDAPDAAAIAAASATGADAIAKQVAERLRQNPGDLSAHLDHQLARFLADESVPDLNTISNLPAEDRELLTALIDGLVNFRNGLRADNNMLLSRKVRPLLDMSARLRSQAELSIPTIALCRSVKGFGVYEPMDARFVAGARNEAIVYCEVGNVSSQQNERGEWESKLSQEAVLYTEAGQRVWSNPPQTTVDRPRNRRHDFFIAQRILLPQNLTINRYILKVTVRDEQVKRVAEAAIPIEIVAGLTPQQPIPGPVATPERRPVEDSSAPSARTAADRQPVDSPRVLQGAPASAGTP